MLAQSCSSVLGGRLHPKQKDWVSDAHHRQPQEASCLTPNRDQAKLLARVRRLTGQCRRWNARCWRKRHVPMCCNSWLPSVAALNGLTAELMEAICVSMCWPPRGNSTHASAVLRTYVR